MLGENNLLKDEPRSQTPGFHGNQTLCFHREQPGKEVRCGPSTHLSAAVGHFSWSFVGCEPRGMLRQRQTAGCMSEKEEEPVRRNKNINLMFSTVTNTEADIFRKSSFV